MKDGAKPAALSPPENIRSYEVLETGVWFKAMLMQKLFCIGRIDRIDLVLAETDLRRMSSNINIETSTIHRHRGGRLSVPTRHTLEI